MRETFKFRNHRNFAQICMCLTYTSPFILGVKILSPSRLNPDFSSVVCRKKSSTGATQASPISRLRSGVEHFSWEIPQRPMFQRFITVDG